MGLVSVNYNPHATIGPLPGLATPPNSYTRFCRRWARTRTPAQPRSLTRQPLPRVGLTRWSSAPRCKVCTAAVLPPSASITDPPDSAIAALRWSVHLPIPSRTVNFLRTRSLVLFLFFLSSSLLLLSVFLFVFIDIDKQSFLGY